MSAPDRPVRAALFGWSVLPERALCAAGPATRALMDAGCATLREAGRWLHALPYGRNADRSDWRAVVRERRGTCSTKHALLAAAAGELGLDARLTVGVYAMSEANTPGVGAVLAAYGLDAIPEAHCYLVVEGRRVDVTRSGTTPAEPIAGFEAEWPIAPDQIGDHKVALHRRFLSDWLARPGAPDLDLEALWAIREACIRALAQGPRGDRP